MRIFRRAERPAELRWIVELFAITTLILLPNFAFAQGHSRVGAAGDHGLPRHPDRLRERQLPLREGRRHALSAREPHQAHDHGACLPGAGGAAPQPRGAGPDQPLCLEARRRALRRLDHVRLDQQPGEGRGPDPGRRGGFRQRRGHRLRRGARRQRDALRPAHDAARARDRSQHRDLQERHRPLRSRAQDFGARSRASIGPHHPRISRLFSLLQPARFHLEQDQAAEPQSASRHGHRRRRHEDRLREGRATASSAPPCRTTSG